MKREIVYKVMATMMPLIAIILLELVLRGLSYGNDLSLFVTDKKNPYLQHLNEKVSLRYFIQEKNATKGKIESFRKLKSKNTVRVFVQGESTAVGFPYFFNGTFPKMLEYGIRQSDPTIQLELINLSMTALNSYALVDFADEIIAQHPDAVIINAGHNEYYGALGFGSNSQFGFGIKMGRVGIWMRKTKVGQLFAKGLSTFFSDGDKIDYHETLMKRMVKDHEIPLQSSIYKLGIRLFETNLRATLQKYADAGIRVYLTNTVCNEKDQKPFISIDKDGIVTREIKKATSILNNNADTAFYTSRMEKLAFQYPNHAKTFFLLGKIYFAQKNTKAKSYFHIAKELDVLRFRAPDEINVSIKTLGKAFSNVVFIDNDSVFKFNSPLQCIGNELILEHIHPNLLGYHLMAKTLFDRFATEEHPLFPTLHHKQFPIVSEMPLTEVDYLTGKISNLLLHEGWPFLEPIPADDGKEKSLEEAYAGAISVNTITWEKAMVQLLHYYLKQEVYEKALKICEGLILEYHDNQVLLEQAVELCKKTKAYHKGIVYGTMQWKIGPNVNMACQLLILQLKMDAPNQALPHLRYLISVGAKPNFVPMLGVVEQLIEAKNRFKKEPTKLEIKREIAELYNRIGNSETAQRYE